MRVALGTPVGTCAPVPSPTTPPLARDPARGAVGMPTPHPPRAQPPMRSRALSLSLSLASLNSTSSPIFSLSPLKPTSSPHVWSNPVQCCCEGLAIARRHTKQRRSLYRPSSSPPAIVRSHLSDTKYGSPSNRPVGAYAVDNIVVSPMAAWLRTRGARAIKVPKRVARTAVATGGVPACCPYVAAAATCCRGCVLAGGSLEPRVCCSGDKIDFDGRPRRVVVGLA
eukprot:364594-Chlamydomonas_euryale.AAC.7